MRQINESRATFRLNRSAKGSREGNILLFLLNDRVLKISGGKDLIEKVGLPANFATKSTLPEAINAMQIAIMEVPDLQRSEPDKAAALAWLINSRCGANAAMFMATTPKIKSPSQIAYKLATTSLTTLGSLLALQQQDRLTSNIINESIWRKAA